jgi:hypothetical protein
MTAPARNGPPRVDDDERYWADPPPELSPRCVWWVERIKAGWRPNRRIGSMAYGERTSFHGVYVWEYLNVLAPLLRQLEDAERRVALDLGVRAADELEVHRVDEQAPAAAPREPDALEGLDERLR